MKKHERSALVVVVLGVILAIALNPATVADQHSVIWDDDGDPSGVLALVFFLVHPDFDVLAATVSPGEADPQPYSVHIAEMLAQLGEEIPVAYGPPSPSTGSNEFPQGWRDFVNSFFGLDPQGFIRCAQTSAVVQPQGQAGDMIADILDSFSSPCLDNKLILFSSGPLTNVHDAYESWGDRQSLDVIREMAANCMDTEIMGGAINVRGNLWEGFPDPMNDKAEFNIWIDPLAAAEVFAGPDQIYLTPLDVTNNVIWDKDDVRALRDIGSCEARLAADLLEALIDSIGGNRAYCWDLDAAALTAIRLAEDGAITVDGKSGVFTWTDDCLEVVSSGQDQGWTRPCNGPTNVHVYNVSRGAQEDLLKSYVVKVFAEAAEAEKPTVIDTFDGALNIGTASEIPVNQKARFLTL